MHPRAKILVADDEENARGALRELLCDEGYEVLAVGDAAAALAQLAAFAPDIVLADATMPRFDGAALLHATRALPSPPSLVLMSPWRPPMVPPARFLAKPIELDRLLALLDEVLVERRTVRAVGDR